MITIGLESFHGYVTEYHLSMNLTVLMKLRIYKARSSSNLKSVSVIPIDSRCQNCSKLGFDICKRGINVS